MILSEKHLKTVSNHTGINAKRLKDMYLGKRSEKEQLLSHALCTIPIEFYNDLSLGHSNKICTFMNCLKEEDINETFGKTLISTFRKTLIYDPLFNVLHNMPLCHIETCKMEITLRKQKEGLFSSKDKEFYF